MFGSEMRLFVLGTKIANNLPIIVSFAIKAVDLIFFRFYFALSDSSLLGGPFCRWQTGEERGAFPENENIGLLWWKHPYFWGKTSVLLPKEVRCFWFPKRHGVFPNGARGTPQRGKRNLAQGRASVTSGTLGKKAAAWSAPYRGKRKH